MYGGCIRRFPSSLSGLARLMRPHDGVGSHPGEPETARFQRVRATFSRGAGIPATPGRPQWVRSANSQSSVETTITTTYTSHATPARGRLPTLTGAGGSPPPRSAIDGLFETASSDFWVRGRTALTSTGRSALKHSSATGLSTKPVSAARDVRPIVKEVFAGQLGYPTEKLGARQQRRLWRRDAGLRAPEQARRFPCTIRQVRWVRRRRRDGA